MPPPPVPSSPSHAADVKLTMSSSLATLSESDGSGPGPYSLLIKIVDVVTREKEQAIKIRQLEARVSHLSTRLSAEEGRTDEAVRAQNTAAIAKARAENHLATSLNWWASDLLTLSDLG